MRKNRTLSLKRETLTELTPAQMAGLAAGSHLLCGLTDNCGELLTHASLDAPCPTLPVLDCVASLPLDECIAR